MQRVPLKEILDASYRSSPRYTLRLFDRLPAEQQELLRDLLKDPEFYGVLSPNGQAGARLKSVCRDTALLYYTLQEPGRLPSYIRTFLGEECNATIAQLVLDGVLEMERDGTFVSGADAYGLIYDEASPASAGGTIARLSTAALQYAQALETDDVAQVSARLYFYNRIPVSPQWKRMLPTPEAVADYLGIQPGGPNASLLDQHWSSVSPAAGDDGWSMWWSRQERPARRESDPTYKLYVSPAPSSLREAFRATLEALAALQAPCFKFGRDVYGLLRPDKIVAYFWSLDELAEAGDCLRGRLAGIPAHGVPFTAELDAEGLLSWGMDPPETQHLLGWQERESWRMWLTNRLAAALLSAKASPSRTVEPWQFALERLRLDGVQTDSWTPAGALWQSMPRKESA